MHPLAMDNFSKNNENCQGYNNYQSVRKRTSNKYRPIPVLRCLSKILQRIMSNRLYSYFYQNKILCGKQFRFRANHSTD